MEGHQGEGCDDLTPSGEGLRGPAAWMGNVVWKERWAGRITIDHWPGARLINEPVPYDRFYIELLTRVKQWR